MPRAVQLRCGVPKFASRLRARHHRQGAIRAFVAPCLLATSLLAAAACSISTPVLRAPEEVPPSPHEGPLKVHLHSGELVVLETWEEDLVARRVVGDGRRFDRDRVRTEVGRIAVPVDSIALLEGTRSDMDVSRGIGLTLLAGYSVMTTAITLECLSDPKSCFGSCPTFYVDERGGEERLAAEGFSSSVTRSLEATDIDDLRLTARAEGFSLRMRNEALETHAVRSMRVLAVPEPTGGTVFQTPDGGFREVRRVGAPLRCIAPEGDCLSAVQSLDGRERASRTDPNDLGTRETIELTFDAPGENRTAEYRAGVVIAARHSFVSTFLFYQMLDDLGAEAGEFLAELERGGGALLPPLRAAMAYPARLRIEVEDATGEWHSVGVLDEAGPLAADVHLLELPAWVDLERPVRVRLDLAQGFWRIEYVALAELGKPVEPRVLTPVALARLDGGPEEGLAAPHGLAALLDPDRYLVTEPGDHYRITFSPTHPSGEEVAGGPGAPSPDASYRLFLESTGHYYEWMRAEWTEDAAPERVIRMLTQPEAVLRELAPAFKAREAEMEEAFWNSRFRR